MTKIAALVVVLAVAPPAFAETMLYLNKDNKSWTMEKTFAFPEECEKAARSAIRNKTALGAGCAPYSTPVFDRRRPQPPAKPSTPASSNRSEATDSTSRKPKTQAEIMADKDVQYYKRVHEGALEAAKGQSGQRAYSNGNSYAGQNVKAAAANLQKAMDAATSK